jgi:3-deoxy-D-manno-octulosonic-acid transferase
MRIRAALYQLSYAGIWVSGLLLCPFHKKIRKTYLGRRGLKNRIKNRTFHSPIWFHVASSGELEQAIPIMEAIKAKSPEREILLTYFSPSGEKAVQLEKSRRNDVPWDYSDYSPWDFFWTANHFIKITRPTHFVAIHREIWPGILSSCSNYKIPNYLFACSLTPSKSSFKWLSHFKLIGVTNQRSRDSLKQIPGLNVEVMGEPRIERVLNRKKLNQGKYQNPGISPIFLGASLWPKDFEALKEALHELLKREWKLVLVPHEIETEFLTQLRNEFVNSQLWSENPLRDNSFSVLIVDKVGFLAELYRISDLVFVGGSFVAKVHNVLEPAAYGRAITTGPYVQNSGEAGELAALDALRVVRSSPELVTLANDFEKQKEMGRTAALYLQSNAGASEKYAEVLLK